MVGLSRGPNRNRHTRTINPSVFCRYMKLRHRKLLSYTDIADLDIQCNHSCSTQIYLWSCVTAVSLPSSYILQTTPFIPYPKRIQRPPNAPYVTSSEGRKQRRTQSRIQNGKTIESKVESKPEIPSNPRSNPNRISQRIQDRIELQFDIGFDR